MLSSEGSEFMNYRKSDAELRREQDKQIFNQYVQSYFKPPTSSPVQPATANPNNSPGMSAKERYRFELLQQMNQPRDSNFERKRFNRNQSAIPAGNASNVAVASGNNIIGNVGNSNQFNNAHNRNQMPMSPISYSNNQNAIASPISNQNQNMVPLSDINIAVQASGNNVQNMGGVFPRRGSNVGNIYGGNTPISGGDSVQSPNQSPDLYYNAYQNDMQELLRLQQQSLVNMFPNQNRQQQQHQLQQQQQQQIQQQHQQQQPFLPASVLGLLHSPNPNNHIGGNNMFNNNNNMMNNNVPYVNNVALPMDLFSPLSPSGIRESVYSHNNAFQTGYSNNQLPSIQPLKLPVLRPHSNIGLSNGGLMGNQMNMKSHNNNNMNMLNNNNHMMNIMGQNNNNNYNNNNNNNNNNSNNNNNNNNNNNMRQQQHQQQQQPSNNVDVSQMTPQQRYRHELAVQVATDKARKQQEKSKYKQDLHDGVMMLSEYNPWGKQGGGAQIVKPAVNNGGGQGMAGIMNSGVNNNNNYNNNNNNYNNNNINDSNHNNQPESNVQKSAIYQQMEDHRLRKEAEKARKKQEEMEEEARLQRERDVLEARYQAEKQKELEKAREKEKEKEAGALQSNANAGDNNNSNNNNNNNSNNNNNDFRGAHAQGKPKQQQQQQQQQQQHLQAASGGFDDDSKYDDPPPPGLGQAARMKWLRIQAQREKERNG